MNLALKPLVVATLFASLAGIASCASAPAEVQATEAASEGEAIDLRVLDEVGKPRDLIQLERQPTGLFRTGFEVRYYEPTFSNASTECQAVTDFKELALYGGGGSDGIRNAVHPMLSGFQDIYGYKYALTNYPDWDYATQGASPEDYAEIEVYLSLILFPSSTELRDAVDLVVNYAEPCDSSQGREREFFDGEIFMKNQFNYYAIEHQESSTLGNFYLVSSTSTLNRYPDNPSADFEFQPSGYDHLIAVWDGNLLFLARYSHDESDEQYLGITAENIDNGLAEIFAEVALRVEGK